MHPFDASARHARPSPLPHGALLVREQIDPKTFEALLVRMSGILYSADWLAELSKDRTERANPEGVRPEEVRGRAEPSRVVLSSPLWPR